MDKINAFRKGIVYYQAASYSASILIRQTTEKNNAYAKEEHQFKSIKPMGKRECFWKNIEFFKNEL